VWSIDVEVAEVDEGSTLLASLELDDDARSGYVPLLDVYSEVETIGKNFEKADHLQMIIDQLEADVDDRERWGLVRLSTSAIDFLGETLANKGLDAFLSIATQRAAKERAPEAGGKPVTFLEPSVLAAPVEPADRVHLTGAYGAYFQEAFRHCAEIIASSLVAAGKPEDALKWHLRQVNPMAPGSPTDKDKYWGYVGFRDLAAPQPVEILLRSLKMLEVYRSDPFNPTAYDNLDFNPWMGPRVAIRGLLETLVLCGDTRPGPESRETVNERLMYYMLALEVAGPRPGVDADCAALPDELLTYEMLGPAMDAQGSLMIDIGTLLAQQQAAAGTVGAADYAAGAQAIADQEAAAAAAAAGGSPPAGTPARDVAALATLTVPGVGLAFCIPADQTLTAIWDRIEDRLYKIHNGLDINGQKQDLPLFAPAIDPMALVRARAAGLDIDAAVDAAQAGKPRHRFSALLPRAKEAAQLCASLESSLVQALASKDSEELTLLRSIHERSILDATTEIKRRQLEEAQLQENAAEFALGNVENRVAYYKGLIDEGDILWEQMEETSRHVATALRTAEGVGMTVAYILYQLPQLGSPFSLNHGGAQLGSSADAAARAMQAAASSADAMASSTGIRASRVRRSEEWQQQLAVAEQEKLQSTAQLEAAKRRSLIAARDLQNHEKSMEHAEELDQFYRNKLTGLGLYTYQARKLRECHRLAFNIAQDWLQQAVLSHREDTGDPADYMPQGGWDAARIGLTSAAQLQVQLLRLEDAHLRLDARRPEITQTFPLSLIAGEALLDLREKGECTFTIDEAFYDLIYPSHVNRRIKSVRITLPGITGAYTNIGAILRLIKSRVRKQESGVVSADLMDIMPTPQDSVSIASSSGVNDAGLFELNFHDERYLPFEGFGAISEWHLSLPRTVRAFDYSTLGDALITVLYVADDAGEKRREDVEKNLIKRLNDLDLKRVFSLRQDFPEAFAALTAAGPPGKRTATVEIVPEHFPYFASRVVKVAPLVTMAVIADHNLGDVKVAQAQSAGGAVAVLVFELTNGDAGPSELRDALFT
ncbi:MAG: hypothetical protein ABWY12_05165, partial [Burkholderiales bacterium]